MPIKYSDPDGDCPWVLIAALLLVSDIAMAPTLDKADNQRKYDEASTDRSIGLITIGAGPAAGRVANKLILKPLLKKAAPILTKVTSKITLKKAEEKIVGEVEKKLVEKAGQQGEAQIVEKVSEKSAYVIAKEGGSHSGFYKTALNQTKAQLEKGIKKLQRQIDEHTELIKNPKETMEKLKKGAWESLDPRQQKALIEKKWPSDILRQKEQQNILKGILTETK
ncbi:hypothetical protein SAMN05660845_1650 [Flavobacterium swingsii]|uniref:Uncharacterized protein n=1 Tax=Flavobacterium swingsii TaxID=498292 RepID=A0A1I0YEG4_9FLAO|nr:hypothetical protein [Flavobacterium swingsii]SFB10890.1 hypothetical protein SAMN05660845_1650 [Flavobacterium swingsii]